MMAYGPGYRTEGRDGARYVDKSQRGQGHRMSARAFMALAATIILAPATAWGQQASNPSIGFLGSESPALFAAQLEMFRRGLAEAGYEEGKNLSIEYRWAEGRNDRLPELAADLVRRQVRVIAAPGTTPAALAAKKATTTIPVVFFTAGDPVALGLVASLSRPGGNLTGATSLGGQLAPKRLELLHEVVPAAKAMALLVNPTNPAIAESTSRELQQAAERLGVRLHVIEAGSERDFEPALAKVAQLGASALVIAIDSFFTGRREQLGALALRYKVPAIYQYRDFAAAGGVMSYGGGLDPYRIAGRYTGRILKGEKPSELPVQQITKVELVINMKAARALGVTVPAKLLALADELID